MSLTDEQKAAGWIEHDGGPCPVADRTPVKVLYRSERLGASHCLPARLFNWQDVPGFPTSADIIAYRPEQQP